MPDAFLLAAARTPIGKFLGGLADVPAVELAAPSVGDWDPADDEQANYGEQVYRRGWAQQDAARLQFNLCRRSAKRATRRSDGLARAQAASRQSACSARTIAATMGESRRSS